MRRALAVLLVLGCAGFKSKEIPPPLPVAQPTAEAKPVPPKAAAPAAPPALPGEAEALGQKPEIGPIPQFDAPVPLVEALPNGLVVYVIERPGDGIEAVQLRIRGGASADPERLPGLHSVLAALMQTGAAGRSQTQLAAAADAIGMTLSVQATQESLAVTGSAMITNLAPMARLVADVALRPALAAGEWERIRNQRRAELVAQRAEPQVAAQLAFRAAAFAGTPFAHGIEGTLPSIDAMKLADVKQVYAGFGPQRAALVAVGGARVADVMKALRSEFSGWRARAASAAESKALPPGKRPRLVLVDFPGKPQSVLMVGQPSAPRSSPDALALEAMNAILGGSFTSRLNQNLREQHGYTYGAGSTFAWGSRFSPFFARSSVQTDVTGPALGEMLKELKAAAQLDESELAKARALLAFELAERMSHAVALASTVGEMWLFGLPNDELRTYVSRLRALTPAAVQAAAKRALDAEQMTIVIAGDRAKVEPQLSGLPLGPAELRGPSGEPVAAVPSSAGR